MGLPLPELCGTGQGRPQGSFVLPEAPSPGSCCCCLCPSSPESLRCLLGDLLRSRNCAVGEPRGLGRGTVVWILTSGFGQKVVCFRLDIARCYCLTCIQIRVFKTREALFGLSHAGCKPYFGQQRCGVM